ncbi:MAG: HEAT repeat domain-containing protein [Planctomycetaceae bacterium]|nr:HEAT repeat domain-containing protein [Planctomycetaceae bacterium]
MAARFSKWSIAILVIAGVLIASAAVTLVLTWQGDQDPNPEIARIQHLQKAGDVPGLVEMSRKQDTVIARKAIGALGPLGEKATPSLIAAMKDARPTVRSKAAVTLNQTISKGVIEQKDAQQALVNAAKNDPDEGVRSSALTTLGHSRAYETMDTILDGMDDPSPAVREAAYQAMRKVLGMDFPYKADDPEPKRRQDVNMIRAAWRDPGFRGRVEEYYNGRFNRIYKRYAR